ncbi:MAG: hypothetical protein EDM05_044365 [Leptolyngbya sp. IPPAS B-1204]|uniref:Uncharacterized protein n=1 Tax=Leptolyngbya sp. NK1-12 TaxID=2547451 RepID=A0AA96WHZ1_9CYAN|nr:hypothetical protein [Leptolyngbya sp. NK1-12]MBF2048408.1 hypothetical protein [Elainella sp. C42_A2020_010]WNZ25449.1 hypothetical protein HJG54_23060 [Leptolyngbya sp. NK1-12]
MKPSLLLSTLFLLSQPSLITTNAPTDPDRHPMQLMAQAPQPVRFIRSIQLESPRSSAQVNLTAELVQPKPIQPIRRIELG